MTTPTGKELLTMDGWPGGVNNRIRETEQKAMRDGVTIPSSQFLREALNVDLTEEGHPLRRQGYSLHTAGYAHSAYGCDPLGVFCVVIDGLLLAGRSPDNLYTQATLNRYNQVEYSHINDSIYYSNGQVIGQIHGPTLTHSSVGVPVAPIPVVTGPATENPNGWDDTRQVAVVYVDLNGEEGGASEPVIVGADGAFTVDIPMPLPSGVSEARIYVSSVSSEILYHAQSTITVSPITIYPSNIGVGKELDTLNLKPPKAGQIVRHFNGRMYVARNDQVFFSEALRFALTRPSQGVYMFPEFVTLLEPSTDGVYVGSKAGVVFLSGSDPYAVTQIHVSPYAPVEKAVARVPGEKFGVPVDYVPVWWGVDGVMVVGLPGGQLKQLTRDRLAVPEFAAGAVSLREYEGMSHVVSSLRRGEGSNPMGATDTVVAEVRRNNIVLNN